MTTTTTEIEDRIIFDHVELDLIRPHEHNPRRDVGDVAELAASIEAQGLLEPLIVADTGDGGDDGYVLIVGHRRLAAAQVAGLQTAPCLIHRDLDEAGQLEMMLVENLQRADLSPVEEAAAYQQLLEFPGYTVKGIAASTGRAAKTVKSRLALRKLPEATLGRVHTGQVSLTDAQALVEFADDPESLSQLEKALGTSNWSWYLQQARQRRGSAKAAAAAEAKLRKSKVRILTRGEQEELDDAADGVGWFYLDANEGLDNGYLPIAPEDHTSCPGHAAVIHRTGGGADVEYMCTEPSRHADLVEAAGAGESGENRADLAAAKAEAAARQKLRDDLATAALARRRHLGEAVLAAAASSTRDVLLRLLRDEVKAHRVDVVLTHVMFPDSDRTATPDELVDVVLTHVMFPDSDRTATPDELVDEAAKLNVDGIAALIDIAVHARDDWCLQEPHAWPRNAGDGWSPDTVEWRDRLERVYGWQWSEVEQHMLTEPPPAVVDVELPDYVDEDDEDDEGGER